MREEEKGAGVTDAGESRSWNIMLSTFQKQRERRIHSMEPSGNGTYDAAACLCSLLRIRIITYERACAACGTDMTLEDLAQNSDFICRRVMLEKNWERKADDPFLCRRKGSSDYMVCIPGYGRSRLLDPVTHRTIRLNRRDMEMLEPEAVFFYRAFPAGQIGFKEITELAVRTFSVRDLAYLLLCTALSTLIGMQTAAMSQMIFDSIIPQGDVAQMIGLGVVLLSCMAASLCFSITGNLLNYRLESTVRYTLQAAIYERTFHLPEKFFQNKDCAEQTYRLQQMYSTYMSVYKNAVQILLQGGFSLMYLWQMHQYSTLLCHYANFFVVLNILVTVGIGCLNRSAQQRRSRTTGRLRALLYQAIRGIEDIRTGGAENETLYAHMKLASKTGLADQSSAHNDRLSGALDTINTAAAILVMYWIYARKGVNISAGSLMGFLTAFTAFTAAMRMVAGNGMDIVSTLPVLRDSSEFLQVPPEMAGTGKIPNDLKGEIRISHVSFRYTKDTEPILDDISLDIRSGEYVAIVGATGCGKSTLLRLLLGFEQPQRGQIFYDATPLQHLCLPALRRRIGVVLQDGGLFSGTLYRNIAVAAPKATREEILRAVEDAQLTEVVQRMPMGLETFVSEQGRTLSGGERQRVLIARALVGRPKILFLDEATSALDNRSQEKICESLAGYQATRVVVAHRLSTIRHCDRIVVLKGGHIAETGSYEELMEQKGAFWELAQRQLLEA